MKHLQWALTFLMLVAGGPEPFAAEPIRTGQLASAAIRECSGVVESRRQNCYWVLSDSGNPPTLFAVDLDGKLLGQWMVEIRNRDWEDIAIDDDGRLYIGDIGNNGNRRGELQVHRIAEPLLSNASTDPLTVEKTWRLTFPTERFDCESLFIDGDFGYVISKVYDATPATLYRFPLKTEAAVEILEPVTTLPILTPVTAADLDPLGRLIVATNTGVHRFPQAPAWEALADAKPATVMLFQPALEAICAGDGKVIGMTENRDILQFNDDHFDAPHPFSVPETVEVILKALQSSVTIDGDLSDWPAKRHSLPLRGSDGGRCLAGWSAKGLYFGLQIPDPKVTPLRRNAWYTGDTVEFFFGRAGAGVSTDYGPHDIRYYVGFEQTAQGQWKLSEPGWPRSTPEAAARVSLAGAVGPDHYTIEAFLPFALIGLETPPPAVRVNISALSREPRGNWYLTYSNRDGTWLSPITWALAELESGSDG